MARQKETEMLQRPPPQSIPDAPGSYQFLDQDGRVIYVGKAKSLRQRVQNYFQPLDALMPRTQMMISQAESIEWIQVDTDVEALVLEYSLIKRHKPRYNVKLRDDKSYPVLAVTVNQPWPKATVTRAARQKGVRYFGPYPHASALRETLDMLQKSFQIRTCSDLKFERQRRLGKPCLLYHIERCKGPCVSAVDSGTYRSTVDDLCSFLKGDTKSIVGKLNAEMKSLSSQLEFERAARIRDRLEAIERVVSKQEVMIEGGVDLDVIGIVADELEASVQVLHIRKGRLLGRRGMIIDRVEDLTDQELQTRVVELHYGETPIELPPEVVVALDSPDNELLALWLSNLRGLKAKITVPKRGHKRSMLSMATENAKDEMKRHRLKRASDHNARAKALTDLANFLELKEAPLRIECYDMSHLQGTNYVGSMVVMEDGITKRADYRRFRVSVPKNDDYGAMEEVLTRRLVNYLAETAIEHPEQGRKFSYPPNLLLVDGGKGQLNVAVRVLESLGLTGKIELASLAKEYEEVFRPDRSDSIRIPRSSPALFLLQQIRDEAHRFAISYHRQLRGKSALETKMDSVAGLGPKRKRAIIDYFGGIAKLKKASLDEISAAKILPAPVALALYESLQKG